MTKYPVSAERLYACPARVLKSLSMRTALLFDIDGTLLHAKGLGRPAFAEAFEVAYGVAADFGAVSFVGATDTAVVRAMAAAHGVISSPAREERFFFELTQRLLPRLERGPMVVYPGVREMLERLCEAGFLLGVVTGNIRATAWGKLVHAGLAEAFSFGAYASDHEDRDQIAAIACERARALGAVPRLLIGDTPKDIQAAHAVGLPCLAVATGWVGEGELSAAGADAVLADWFDASVAMSLIRSLCRE